MYPIINAELAMAATKPMAKTGKNKPFNVTMIIFLIHFFVTLYLYVIRMALGALP